jgi:hypothetical protein
MQPIKLNFKLYQGSTFKEVFRWESGTKVYKPISGISQNAPCVIQATGHGLPVGWRFKVTNVVGMKEIISTGDNYYICTSTDTDSITINSLNSIAYNAYVSGGVVEYNQPVDLSGFTARMQIREKIDSPTTILELTTENGGILIDNITKTITLVISATTTAALTFSSALYSLELIKGIEVTPFLVGSLSLVKEVTR